jgi:hypothetical protein
MEAHLHTHEQNGGVIGLKIQKKSFGEFEATLLSKTKKV